MSWDRPRIRFYMGRWYYRPALDNVAVTGDHDVSWMNRQAKLWCQEMNRHEEFTV